MLKYFFYFLMTWFIGHLIFISFDGLIDSDQPADVAVILGSTVYSDSTLSPRLQARLEKGVEVYHSGQVKKDYCKWWNWGRGGE